MRLPQHQVGPQAGARQRRETEGWAQALLRVACAGPRVLGARCVCRCLHSCARVSMIFPQLILHPSGREQKWFQGPLPASLGWGRGCSLVLVTALSPRREAAPTSCLRSSAAAEAPSQSQRKPESPGRGTARRRPRCPPLPQGAFAPFQQHPGRPSWRGEAGSGQMWGVPQADVEPGHVSPALSPLLLLSRRF